MSAAILKARAKRLGVAIQKTLGHKASHSQLLELVAQEENYPNWDAACKSFADTTLQSEVDMEVESKYDRWRTPYMKLVQALIERFKGAGRVPGSFRLYVGTVGSGKTTRLHNDLLSYANGRRVFFIGYQEMPFDPGIRLVESLRDIDSETLIVIDEANWKEELALAGLLSRTGLDIVSTAQFKSLDEAQQALHEDSQQRMAMGGEPVELCFIEGRGLPVTFKRVQPAQTHPERRNFERFLEGLVNRRSNRVFGLQGNITIYCENRGRSSVALVREHFLDEMGSSMHLVTGNWPSPDANVGTKEGERLLDHHIFFIDEVVTDLELECLHSLAQAGARITTSMSATSLIQAMERLKEAFFVPALRASIPIHLKMVSRGRVIAAARL
ncbi:glyoxalase superfamily protein [Pseudomonas aeruginosa]